VRRQVGARFDANATMGVFSAGLVSSKSISATYTSIVLLGIAEANWCSARTRVVFATWRA
jgi:hypothetical protein